MFDVPKSLFALLQEYYVIIKFSGQVVNFHVCPILNFLRSQAVSIIFIRSYIRKSNELDFQMNVENVGSHISILREFINIFFFSISLTIAGVKNCKCNDNNLWLY